MPLPIKIFEISDVVLRDTTSDVGAHNDRHLCALYYANVASFEVLELLHCRGACDRSAHARLHLVGVEPVADGARLAGSNHADAQHRPGARRVPHCGR